MDGLAPSPSPVPDPTPHQPTSFLPSSLDTHTGRFGRARSPSGPSTPSRARRWARPTRATCWPRWSRRCGWRTAGGTFSGSPCRWVGGGCFVHWGMSVYMWCGASLALPRPPSPPPSSHTHTHTRNPLSNQQGKKEAEACHAIREELFKRGYDIPLVADIHFQPKVRSKTRGAHPYIQGPIN